MKLSNLSKAAICCCAMLGAGVAKAIPVSYDFTWTGDNSMSMVGLFTGDDVNSDNVIRDTEVTSLMFEIFDAGGSLGAVSGAQALTGGAGSAFNFNFDLLLGTFQDGNSLTGNGQLWNVDGPGVGFFDGSASAGFRVDGINVGGSTHDPQNYTATLRTASVPEPSILALLVLGLFGLAFNRRKRL